MNDSCLNLARVLSKILQDAALILKGMILAYIWQESLTRSYEVPLFQPIWQVSYSQDTCQCLNKIIFNESVKIFRDLDKQISYQNT